MLEAAFSGISGVEVTDFDGLLVDFMRSRRVRYNVRGIRNETDENYERNMFDYNKKLYPELENVYIKAEKEFENISSTAARAALEKDEDLSRYLTENVKIIAEKYKK